MGFALTILYIVVTIISPEQFGSEWATYHALAYLAAITFVASLPSMAENRYWKSIQIFLLFGLMVAIGLSQIANGWLGGALESWRAFLPSAAVFFFIVVNVTTIRRLKIAILATVGTCLVVAVEALCAYYAGFHGEMFILRNNLYSAQDDVVGQLIRLRGAGFLSDPNDLAQILLIALPLLFIAWRRKHTAANFFIVILPAALLLWTTYLTHSRGGLIALTAIALMVRVYSSWACWRSTSRAGVESQRPTAPTGLKLGPMASKCSNGLLFSESVLITSRIFMMSLLTIPSFSVSPSLVCWGACCGWHCWSRRRRT
jgi:putative inorganic carbon (HCO3(-)) transporter